MPHPLRDGLRPRIQAQGLIGRQGKPYHADPGLLAAANVALTLMRPLLLTGEPGCGKTDFAWAASGALAAALGHGVSETAPLQCYVRSDTRSRDLLYTYDAVRRFGDAHHGGAEGLARASDPRHYIELEALGWALISTERRVVLIDEIDKAPRDLPNDLLRELDQTSFEISEIPASLDDVTIESHGVPLRRVMKRADGPDGRPAPAPLIVITSNVERQLPDAFLRRCIFWHIEFPVGLLPDILDDHCPEARGDLPGRAIAVFTYLRKVPGLNRKPGTAELIDWVHALTRVYDPSHAARTVHRFSDHLANGACDIPWRELPALGCLVKLREDQDTLAPT
jgi:MoxR-like ATPase